MKRITVLSVVLFIVAFFMPQIIAAKASITPEECPVRVGVHMGSFSMDQHDIPREEIEEAVEAYVDAIPEAEYLVIGSYLDYVNDIRNWIEVGHDHDLKIALRPAGFNSWQGRNGAEATGTPQQHIEDFQPVLVQVADLLEPCDILEPFPDESSNGEYWKKYENGVGTNDESLAEYNAFLQDSILAARETLDGLGLEDVIVEEYHDSPSAASEFVIDQETAEMLDCLGTDNYPEIDITNDQYVFTPAESATAMERELLDWVVEEHDGVPRCITFGPNTYHLLDEEAQAEAFRLEFEAILDTVNNLEGITVWQFGAEFNPNEPDFPKARLFDHVDGEWAPREATEVVNEYFRLFKRRIQLQNQLNMYLRAAPFIWGHPIYLYLKIIGF